jgi:hypothetical protein
MPGINNPDPLEFFRILRVCYSKSHGALAAKLSTDAGGSSNATAAAADQGASAAATTSRDAQFSASGIDRPTGSSPSRRQSLACDGYSLRSADVLSQLGGHSRLSPMNSVNATPIVCYETFTPELVRDLNEEDTACGSGTVGPSCERLEKMRETFSKVIAFLRNTGMSCIRIHNTGKTLIHSINITIFTYASFVRHQDLGRLPTVRAVIYPDSWFLRKFRTLGVYCLQQRLCLGLQAFGLEDHATGPDKLVAANPEIRVSHGIKNH